MANIDKINLNGVSYDLDIAENVETITVTSANQNIDIVYNGSYRIGNHIFIRCEVKASATVTGVLNLPLASIPSQLAETRKGFTLGTLNNVTYGGYFANINAQGEISQSLGSSLQTDDYFAFQFDYYL